MGRGYIGNGRARNVLPLHIRVSQIERDNLVKEAARRKLSLSAWVRKLMGLEDTTSDLMRDESAEA